MRVLIVGEGKTGTTGLYNSIKRSVRARRDDWYCLFEPVRAQQLRALAHYAPERPLLTKITLDKVARVDLHPGEFHRRVLVVRDPRDTLVSMLLFRPLVRGSLRRVSPDDFARFIDAIKEKEADPASHSVRELHELGNRLQFRVVHVDSFMTTTIEQQDALTRDCEFFVSKYENFVAGALDQLSDYLGYDLGTTEAAGASWLAHITRSKSQGEWKHWFTPSDVDYFRPIIDPYLERYGYELDWDLAAKPCLDPTTSSGYIEQKLETRTRQLAARYVENWSADTVSDDEVRQLREMADDGDGIAAHRLALVLSAGTRVAPDPAGAFHWAQEAAVQGDAHAMRTLAGFLRTGNGCDADVVRAARWEAEADALIAQEALRARFDATRRNARQAEARARKLETSVNYELGSVIVDLAHPSHGGAKRALRRLRVLVNRRRERG